jgi:hypothetical protein
MNTIEKIPSILERMPTERINWLRTQGERMTLILGWLVAHTEDSAERLGRVRFTFGECIYVSFRRRDIEHTCCSPSIHEIRISRDPERILYVNTTLEREKKEEIIEMVARRLGYSPGDRNQLKGLINQPISLGF